MFWRRYVYTKNSDGSRWYLVQRGFIAAYWIVINTRSGEVWTSSSTEEFGIAFEPLGKRFVLRAFWDDYLMWRGRM